MPTKEYAGVAIELNDEGYFTQTDQWTREVAAAMASEDGLELTEKHYEVLEYIRAQVNGGKTLTIRGIGKSGIIDIKGFYQLFPGAPLKKSTKFAGVAKPASCI